MKTVTTISALHEDEEKWMVVFIHTMMTTTTSICIILYISLIIQHLLVWQLLSITLDLSSKDESESGQMVSEKINELLLMYIFHKQCEIMAKIQWNSSNYQLHWFHIDFLWKWPIMDQNYANANAFFSVLKNVCNTL